MDQNVMLRKSYDQLSADSEAFTEFFYNRLFEMDDSIRSMFPESMTQQKKKLFQTLGVAVKAAEKPESIRAALKTLGQKHVEYGVINAHYDLVGCALVDSIGEFLQLDPSDPLLTIWSKLYRDVSSIMKGS